MCLNGDKISLVFPKLVTVLICHSFNSLGFIQFNSEVMHIEAAEMHFQSIFSNKKSQFKIFTAILNSRCQTPSAILFD